MDELQNALDALQPEQDFVEPQPEPPPPGAAARADTAVPLERLGELNASLLTLPTGFAVHRKLERAREKRAQVLAQPDERTVDWATAEELALASILCRRHQHPADRRGRRARHVQPSSRRPSRRRDRSRARAAADAAAGASGVRDPQQPALRKRRPRLRVRLQRPGAVAPRDLGSAVRRLHQRRAGDHRRVHRRRRAASGVSGRRCVLLLPHAHEGQGPDHASARPERFLQLAADINMRIANCTTAAQYFHLLRRQAALLLTDPLPLVVLTPKSLLRHPMVASAPRELAEGRFRMLIDDEEARRRAADIRRVVVCSGKVYVDLTVERAARRGASRSRSAGSSSCIRCRCANCARCSNGYASAEEIVWVQEEPENMGAWDFIRPHLAEVAGGRPVRLIARPRSASPAEGSAARHSRQQQALVDAALSGMPTKARGTADTKPATVAG